MCGERVGGNEVLVPVRKFLLLKKFPIGVTGLGRAHSSDLGNSVGRAFVVSALLFLVWCLGVYRGAMLKKYYQGKSEAIGAETPGPASVTFFFFFFNADCVNGGLVRCARNLGRRTRRCATSLLRSTYTTRWAQTRRIGLLSYIGHSLRQHVLIIL